MLQADKYKKRITTDVHKYQVARRGEFVFDPMSLYYGAIGRQDSVDRGLISPDYVAFEVDDTVDASFLDYLLRWPGQHALYESNSETGNQFGKRRRLYWSVLKTLTFDLPPIREQRKIAAVLSAVDDAIATTEAVIDQLQVVKKSLMQELLTRGLPGRHTRFKMTEVGEVPEEWEVTRLAALLDAGPSNGKSPPSRTTPPGVPTFSIAAVRDGRVSVYDHLKYADLDPEEARRYRVAAGDILIVRGNANPDLVGKCGVVDDAPNGCIYPDILMRVSLRRNLLPNFFVTLWNSDVVHDQILDKAKTTNGTFKINGSDVRSVVLVVPSAEEQTAIGGAIRSAEEAVERHKGEVGALLNLKSSLMSVLLTGDVRVHVGHEVAA